jgi:NAD(P)-dependent dehydrogenase (short-subunit alcohol dehydrogenase family)
MTDRSTFGVTTTALEAVDGIDLTGRTVVITGASPNSIGIETARALATAGATLVLGLRDAAKASAAVDDLRASMPGASIDTEPLDLTSLASVRAFAAAVMSRHPQIDVLVNNAGVMATPFERTSDGFELQFGTNHLGHFLLTHELMPALLAGGGGRVVNLSSMGHMIGGVDLDDPNYERRHYSEWPAYGASKSANILFTLELDRRYGGQGIHSYAVHPGTVDTDLFRHLDDDAAASIRRRSEKGGMPIKTPAQGASTSVVAITATDLPGGAYLDNCQVSDGVADHAKDPDVAARLWTLSEQLVGAAFPA